MTVTVKIVAESGETAMANFPLGKWSDMGAGARVLAIHGQCRDVTKGRPFTVLAEVRRAIWFYTSDEIAPGEQLVMNYANNADDNRHVESTYEFLKGQNGKTLKLENRGHGQKRQGCVIVTDRPGLEKAARAAGISITRDNTG